jgi:hypothetical protein
VPPWLCVARVLILLWFLVALIVEFLRLGSSSDFMVGEACANDGGDSRGGHTAGMKSFFRIALSSAARERIR